MSAHLTVFVHVLQYTVAGLSQFCGNFIVFTYSVAKKKLNIFLKDIYMYLCIDHFSCQIIIDLTKMFYPNQPQTRNHTRNISYIIVSIICLGYNSLHISYSSIQMDNLPMQYEPIRHICTIIFIDELHNKTLVDTNLQHS